MDIKTILFPTDFSESDHAALEYASRLASESGALLYIVHTDDMERIAAAMSDAGHPYPSPWDDKGRRKAHVKLRKVVPTVAGVKFRHRNLDGTPTAQIVSFAERKGVDLIVMGSHGRSGIARVLMGSTAEGVMRRAPCPVLIVKQPTEEKMNEEQEHSRASAASRHVK
jgi:nucleotide-binding universal stress UspA family protein